MLLPALPLLVPLFLSLFAGLGCAHDAQALRGDKRERTALSSRTEDFWRAIEWQDAAGASTYIEDEAVRQRWSIEAERMVSELHVTDSSLVDIVLSDVGVTDAAKDAAKDAAADDHRRTATVTVRAEGYTLPAQIMGRQTVVQTWYRSDHGWFLDWDHGSPLTGLDW